MWRRANINPALVQRIVPVVQPVWSRPTDYGWMDTGQHRRRWPNIWQALGQCRLALRVPQPSKHEALNQCCFYAGPASQMVGQNWTSIGSTSCVCWECWQTTFVFCTSPGVQILKSVAQLIEPKDDLVTLDHLPGSKSWHSEASGVANLAGENVVDIKTVITKAIDTTSISYQLLWLRCWRGDISSFYYKKTRLF